MPFPSIPMAQSGASTPATLNTDAGGINLLHSTCAEQAFYHDASQLLGSHLNMLPKSFAREEHASFMRFEVATMPRKTTSRSKVAHTISSKLLRSVVPVSRSQLLHYFPERCLQLFILQNTRQWQTVFVFAMRFGVLASGTTNVKLDGMDAFHVTNSGLDGVIPTTMITVFGTNPTTCTCEINCNIAHFCFYQLRRAMWQTQDKTQGLMLQQPRLSINALMLSLRLNKLFQIAEHMALLVEYVKCAFAPNASDPTTKKSQRQKNSNVEYSTCNSSSHT